MSTVERSLKPYPPSHIAITDTSEIPAATDTISEDFDDNSINVARWTYSKEFGSLGTNGAEVSSRFEITPTPNTTGYVYLRSNYGCSILNTSLLLDVISYLYDPPGYNGNGIYLRDIANPTNNNIRIDRGGGWLTMSVGDSVSGNSTIGSTTGFDATKWRIAFNDTTNVLTMDYFLSGSWTTKHTHTLGWTPSNVKVEIFGGNWGTGNSSTDKYIVDNLVLTGESGGLPPSGQARLNWNIRSRLSNLVRKNSDASDDPEVDQRHEIEVYGEDGTTLLRTASGVTGDQYDYTAAFEAADTGLGVLQTELTFKMRSTKDALESQQLIKTLVR